MAMCPSALSFRENLPWKVWQCWDLLQWWLTEWGLGSRAGPFCLTQSHLVCGLCSGPPHRPGQGFLRVAPWFPPSLISLSSHRRCQAHSLVEGSPCLLLPLSLILPADKSPVLLILSQHLHPRGLERIGYLGRLEDILRIFCINSYRISCKNLAVLSSWK